MGIAQMEEIVATVKAILKTLECPICLDLLKTPVSAGCGHFFCRECVSGILQSTYRAPCPLCKRSFTRRSIQEATQRQSVIAAAQKLANTCTSLTEVPFYANDATCKPPVKVHEDLSIQSKKLKTSKSENQDAPSRKRKSCEIEGNVKSSDSQNAPEKEMNDCIDISENPEKDDYSSPNKRVCPASDDDSEDLPRLEDVFKEMAKSRQSTYISKKNEKAIEKPLIIQPTDKVSAMKTYSSIHRKAHKSSLSNTDSGDAFKSKATSSSDKKFDILMENTERNEAAPDSFVKTNNNSIQAKNKINALKNKTNEVQSGAAIIQNDSDIKVKNGNKIKSDIGNKSKENALKLSPKTKKIDKLRRKSHTKFQNSGANLSSDEIGLKKTVVSNEKNSNKQTPSSPVKRSDTKDCYTLDQVTLHLSPSTKRNEESLKNQIDDPSKLLDLVDTAVSVDSVTSPLGSKNIILNKSPGWSRVRKGKKDFKLKQFTSLHVEKNSPTISSKSSTASDQDIVSKIDNSVDASTQNRNEDNSLDSANEDAMNVAPKDLNSVLEKEVCEVGETVASSDENILADKEIEDGKHKNILNNAQKSGINFEKMDCIESVENECSASNSECNVGNNVSLNNPPQITIVPSVSITSNSLICAKFAEANDKVSSHNVLKSQKIVCELKQASSTDNDLISQNGNFITKYIQHSGLNKKDDRKLFNNTSGLKQASFSLPYTDYQNFNAQSVEGDQNYQYVEQSQQTSQVINLDLQNPFCDNIRAIIPHQPPLLMCPNTEKTKVVKRTCLTLEEVQDCFFKSSQNGTPEIIYSAPFFSGLFKLDIRVADETLNISILKVIDSAPETSNLPNASSILSDKSIQAPSTLFPPNEVVPSSNAGSESSQPESNVDPFPYLNKESATNLVEKPVQATSEFSDDNSMPLTEPNLAIRSVAMQHEPASLHVELQEKNVPDETSESKNDYDDNCMDEDDLNMSEIIHFPSNPTEKNNPDQDRSSFPKSVPENENHEQHPQENDNAVNECEVILHKLDTEEVAESDTKNEVTEHLEESDTNNKVSKHFVQSDMKNLSSNTTNNISFANAFAKCKEVSDKNVINTAVNSNKSEQISFDKSSSSDEDESLKKLQQCLHKEKKPEKKQSRLSLKKRSSFKRIQVQDSSDESDSETSASSKNTSKKTEKDVFVKPENPPKLSSIADSFSSLRELNFGDNSKKNLFNSAPVEMPSTLSSTVSEDACEANASDIILEIEDLSDKIKYLEEKLKNCGHGENKQNRGDSDSEDSIDLFPQSVPPTPPNKM